MWKKLCDRVSQSNFRTILCTVLILFTLVPLCLVQQILVHVYEKYMIHNTCIHVTSALEANNRNLDVMLDNLETTAQLMVNSDFYYNIFSEISGYSVADYLGCDREIRAQLARQFSLQSDIWDVYFYVPGWTLGDNHSALSDEEIKRAGYAEIAHLAGGGAKWITGYDYGETIGSEYLMKKDSYEYRYLMTMVKEMDFQYAYKGSYYSLPPMDALPVLVLHIKEESIRKTYQEKIDYEDSFYIIANRNGKVVSSSTEEFLISKEMPEALMECYGVAGYDKIRYNGIEYLLCYDTMTQRDLCAFSLIPMTEVTDRAVADTRKIQYILLIVMGSLSVGVALFLSRYFSTPIDALVEAAKRAGTGDFRADTPVPSQREFQVLTKSFNDMERKISKLIYENYEIELREKESHLMALSLQINPHFLYNTLNTIHIMALQNGDIDTSEVIISLSEMLQYTVRNHSEKGSLEDEEAWLSNYLYIMRQRYRNKFHTDIEIEETIMNAKIPKLMFQPFLENAIIHGFSSIDYPGVIQLKISKEGDFLNIRISDNGVGMEMSKMEDWEKMSHKEGHIGISNVYQRLALYYADAFSMQIQSAPGLGTTVEIRIPYEES